MLTLDHFHSLKIKSITFKESTIKQRLELLEKLKQGLIEFQDQLVAAISQDFNKPEAEILLTEIYPLLQELKDAKKNLKKWLAPKKVPTPLTLYGSKSWIQYQAKGVVLIIAPWNYPLMLAIAPLIPALASGNIVVLKPSELTPQTSATLKKMLEKIFPEGHVYTVEGGVKTANELLELPFDHIFFTGSTPVGKIIMEAAAKNLTPVTLELGGKSPCLILDDADIKVSAEKISWGKFINGGQSCIAPDYVLVPHNKVESFKIEMLKISDAFSSQLPTSIITERHAQRLKGLQDEIPIANCIQKKLFFAESLNSLDAYKIMQEEIFGPLLPVLPYEKLEDAIFYINNRPKPLALYIFGKKDIHNVLNKTTSGGVSINDTMMHISHPHLPFGGIGESGMGQYHGEFGIQTFSHMRGIFKQGPFGFLMRLVYPPYTNTSLQLIRWLIKLTNL